MKLYAHIHPVLLAIILLFICSSDVAAVDRIQSVREFFIDPPTLNCLGFRWYIYGDDDGDGSVTVSYRKAGEHDWKKALPMLRVNREVANWDFRPYACENLFAGSIFNLDPDTGYEVRCVMHDPDGGEPIRRVLLPGRYGSC